ALRRGLLLLAAVFALFALRWRFACHASLDLERFFGRAEPAALLALGLIAEEREQATVDRADAGQGLLPAGEVAVRVVSAAVELALLPRHALDDLAAVDGAEHAGLKQDGLRTLALRILRAGEEGAEASALDCHL